MTAAAKIVVLGSINADLVVRTAHLPSPGETILADTLVRVPGGKGGNQAVAAARAGGGVAFLGSVGTDDAGGMLREHLTDAGVDTTLLDVRDGPSGLALITVDDAAENTIVVVPGANAGRTDIDDRERAAIAGAALLVCQLEVPLGRVVAAATHASAHGVPVLLNPSPVHDLPPDLIAVTTVLVVNQGEAAALGEEVLSHIPHVVTTLGPGGARYHGAGTTVELAAPHVEAIDTTGAGDAFTGALAVAWSQGAAPEAALAAACAAGALATTVAGAGRSAPDATAIADLVRRTYPDLPSGR